MTDASTAHEASQRVEVSDQDGRTASATVFMQDELVVATGQTVSTAHAFVERVSGHLNPGARGSLVDAVMHTSEVHHSVRLQVTVPLGDSETLFRFAEICGDVKVHAAGSTAMIDATVPETLPE